MELATATLTLTVGASTDDAVLNDSGYADDSTLSALANVIGTPGAATTAANSGQGWRFTSVTLATADTVNSAILKLMKQNTQFSQMNNRWTCVNQDNTATFSSGSAPGSRAIVATIVADNNNVNETDGTVYNFPRAGADQTTFGGAVANVTARAGWASGNALAVVNQSKQDASQGTGFSRKTWHDWDSVTASSEPQLVIDYTAAAGGTTYNITPSGGITPAGTVAKRLNRALAGAITPAGALVRALIRSLAGGITPAGTLAKQLRRALAGGVTPTGTVATIRVLLRTFTGGITPAGTIVRQLQRSVTGGVTPNGTVARSLARSLAGTLGPAGTALKQLARALAGALTPSGTVGTSTVVLPHDAPARIVCAVDPQAWVGVAAVAQTGIATTADPQAGCLATTAEAARALV